MEALPGIKADIFWNQKIFPDRLLNRLRCFGQRMGLEEIEQAESPGGHCEHKSPSTTCGAVAKKDYEDVAATILDPDKARLP